MGTRIVMQRSPRDVAGYAECTDETRTALCGSCAVELFGAGWVMYTDGHRLAAVKADDWRAYERPNQASVANVVRSSIEDGLDEIGTACGHQLSEALSMYSKQCHVRIEFPAVSTVLPTVEAYRPARYSRQRKVTREKLPISRCAPAWVPALLPTVDFAVNARYLAEAMLQMGHQCTVWQSACNDPEARAMAPLVITPGGKLEKSDMFAIVMPERI